MSDAIVNRPSADRNLLFGILALQMDFVSREALIAAMNAWVLAKDKTLGQILVEQGALAPKRLSLLEALVEEHLDNHGRDPAQSLAAVDPAAIAHAKLEQVDDPELKASLARALGTPSGDRLNEETALYQPTRATGTRFVILRPHARGGLGEVFVALDEELKREVALKAISERNCHDTVSRARFVQEAEITGRLEHPGIVPVYGFGEHEDGRPYYAMRFVKGDSLQQAIKRFHETKVVADRPYSLALRKLLGAFIAVCQAIHYAHSRGILHRDLKPDNIMLGKFGETLVVDWGLAKPLDQMQSSTEKTENSLDEAPLRPSSGSGSVETMAGTAIGTPGYMSPEQAAGRNDLMGPASDVYGLGATLYCLLTGKAPFSGGDMGDIGDVLQRVQKGDFPSPRSVDSRIAPALEAICLKAMALAPAQRYASALELSEEIEHWLADEPVKAYPEPRRARLARWGRRHKALVASAAALLLAAVVGLSLGIVLLGKANTEIQGQRDQAEQNLQEAQRQHDLAVANLYTSLVGEARALRVARGSGFRIEAWKRLDQARVLDTPERNLSQLRLEAVASLGDFVGLEPIVWEVPRGQSYSAYNIAVDPTGDLMAQILSIDDTSEVLIRNLDTGREVARIRADGDSFTRASFSSDGKNLFTGESRGTVRIWKVSTDGEWVCTQTLPTQPRVGRFVTPSLTFPFFVTHWVFPRAIYFASSADGERLATCYWHRSAFSVPSVSIWRLADASPEPAYFAMQTPAGAETTLTSVAYSPRGDLLAAVLQSSGSNERSAGTYQIVVWDVATHELKRMLQPDLGEIFNICFSADGNSLACAGNNGVAVFDTTNLQRRLFVLGDFPQMVAFSPDNRLLAIATWHFGVVRLWNVTTNREVAVLRHPGAEFVAFSADGKRLVTASPSAIRTWNLGGANEKSILSGHSGGVPGLAFSPDGKLLASTGKDRVVRLWDPVTGKMIRELTGSKGPTQSVTFTLDGRFLISTGWLGRATIWEIASGREVATLPAELPAHWNAAFSPNGKYFMGCSSYGVKLWSVLKADMTEDGRPRFSFEPSPGPQRSYANSACFSPDSRLVAWIDFDFSNGATQLSVWDLSKAEGRSWPVTVFPYLALSFMPDSRHLALVNSEKGLVEVRDAITGELSKSFGDKELLQGSAIHTALSSDGAWLAVGGSKAVTIWDLNKQELVLALPEERGTVWSLAWSPNKELLAVGSSDGGLFIWNLPKIKTELGQIGLSW